MKKHIIWAALAATGMSAGPALAQGELDSTMGASDTPKAAALATDRNGDGMISRDEVTPGTNLANRFDDRDQNGDGMLTQDEYYLPQMGLGVNNADEIYREQQDGAPMQGMAPGGAGQDWATNPESDPVHRAQPGHGDGGSMARSDAGGAGGEGGGG